MAGTEGTLLFQDSRPHSPREANTVSHVYARRGLSGPRLGILFFTSDDKERLRNVNHNSRRTKRSSVRARRRLGIPHVEESRVLRVVVAGCSTIRWQEDLFVESKKLRWSSLFIISFFYSVYFFSRSVVGGPRKNHPRLRLVLDRSLPAPRVVAR